ncbi:MAG TPA: amidohydrolase [Gammaproteobacteria bacterium]|jgi:hippurate hydrolase|nr:peptidase M20 [Chromatiales bacterium]MCP4924456.1 amidohydrolase [Gammaproteobacteria bacterium]MDP7296756.1 amidohydrolase [Gammaproteobacteria bacterium]HJP38217.1 amidohydrolase [Gammaproteobacteria bacterium]
MFVRYPVLLSTILLLQSPVFGTELNDAVRDDYETHLAKLFDYFHRNPELSLVEFETAKRMASELREAGFEVTENVGGTGVVAIMKNGAGPLVMMRADMDGLPVEEKSGLPNASRKQQQSPISGATVYTMHACGHDVHITSLVGTARQMAARRNQWSGTLMLVVQPAEERVLGAKAMRADRIWERFGTPDYALAFHVASSDLTGTINITEGSPYAGADTVDIIIHGVGAHGAYPHRGKDPIVLGSQIVLALQTLVARELPPREPGVVTVGSFHAGTKHNIISDTAHLQLTVRNTNEETRQLLLNGIKRIAVNMGRAAGLPEDKLPEVIISEESVPPTINDPVLTRRLKNAWVGAMGASTVVDNPVKGMGAEDFPYFSVDPAITSVYWQVGGTPAEDFKREAAGGEPVASHHSPLFKVAPESSVRVGVESTVVALMELMGR